jgi:hypothetical protein
MTTSDDKQAAKNLRQLPAPRSARRWYTFGFALLGAAVGYFAGSSQSPVIGTLLPLLFGLVGGAGGLYLARIDFDDAKSCIRLEILGKSLAFFIVCALLGSAYGISLRTQRSVWSFISPSIFLPESESTLPDSVSKDPRRAMRVLLLRARVRALGASLEEERSILNGAIESMQNNSYDLDGNMALWEETDRVLSILLGDSDIARTILGRGPSHLD